MESERERERERERELSEWVFICLHFAPPKKLFLLCPNLDRKEKAEK